MSQKIDLSEEMIDRAYEEAEEAEREALEEAREKRSVFANRPMVYGPIPGTCTIQLYVEGQKFTHTNDHQNPQISCSCKYSIIDFFFFFL